MVISLATPPCFWPCSVIRCGWLCTDSELVDYVQALQPPTSGGDVEMEVHSPELMLMFSLMPPDRASGFLGSCLLVRRRPLLSFLLPEPLHLLVIHH